MARKGIKPLLLLGVAGSLALAGCSGETQAADSTEAAETGKLVISSWGGAYAEATRGLAAEFTEDTGIEVEVLDAGNHVSMVQSMDQTGTVEWDILDGMALQDGYFLNQEGLLANWDDDTRAALEDAYGADNVTDYDYSWSGYGMVVVCNEDAVAACPTTIEEFFDTEAFPGNRMLPGDPGFFGVLVNALAVATGSERDALFEESEGVDRIAEGLRAVAPSTTVWYTSGDQQNQAMLQGEPDMGIMARGSAFAVQDEGVNLNIAWDGLYVTGSSSILADAPNKESALKYVTWLAENPEAQAKWATALQYTVPHPEALDFIEPDVAERLANYPANFEGLYRQDYVWHSNNKAEIDSTFLDIIAGG